MKYIKEIPLLTHLFRSRARGKVLQLFSERPNTHFYSREVGFWVQEDHRNVWLALQAFERLGVLVSQRKGRLRLYQANRRCTLFQPLRRLVIQLNQRRVKFPEG